MQRLLLVLVLFTGCLTETDTEEVGESPSELGVAVIARGSSWKYWDAGGDLGTAWRGNFDDASWATGAGPLGYGESYVRTTVSYGPDADEKYVTTYFRRAFMVDDPAAVTAITGEVMYDDGFVVYLNGTRIGRASMPSGSYDADTPALGHEARNTYRAFDWTAQRSLLLPGPNVIAVEVHQASVDSSDLVFDLALRLTTPPPAPEDIPRGSTWSYFDGRRAPDRHGLWKSDGDYDDSGWGSGSAPLGYGESYLATPISYGPSARHKHVTAYFRHWFTVDAPSADTTLIGEVMYDDGAVIYLNGHEISRLSMPDGYVSPFTRAFGHEADERYQRSDWSAFNDLLVPGPNLVAVEVHQAYADSSDLVFDLALDVGLRVGCGIPGCPVAVPPPAADLHGVWVGPDAVWVAGEQGVIGRRALPEGSWCWCAPDPGVTLKAVWGTGEDDLWFVGTEGRVYHQDGAGFATIDAGTTATLQDVWGSGPAEVFVVGDGGTARRFDGSVWSAVNLGPDQDLFSIWGSSADDIWVGGREPAPYPDDPMFDGYSAIIHRWQPASATWLEEASFTMYYGAADFDGIHGTGPDDVWAVGTFHPAGAAVPYSQAVHYDGTSWTNAGTPESIHGDHTFRDVLALGADVWIVASWGTTVHHDGAAWSEGDDKSRSMFAIDGRTGEVWAAGVDGKILRWNGVTWVQDW